ncbi:MAG TPA: adenylate/guanylate cyclase domain-containing protein [Dehalococcoidia bacterium]|nr:adenylate/guanylate cyclase domain-containing protein [Dehalococcoidia bacterium]
MERDPELEAEVLGFMEQYHRDAARGGPEAVRSRTSPGFVGFGSAADERYDGRDQLLTLLKRDNSEVERIERDYKWIRATQHGPLIIFAMQYDVRLTVAGRTSVVPARLTGVLERHHGGLRRLQTHMSFPASDQPEGRSWPTPIEAIAAAVSEERPDLRAQAAPDGTVTMLFTDIENSTVLTERLGDAQWLQLLLQHNAIVREQFSSHRCFEVKSQGDGFMVASQSARRAVQCAIGIQRGLAAYNETASEPIHVRMGLHTGEVLKDADDFFGKHVILASRIAGKARGGEILASALLKDLTDSGGDIFFGAAREVELKGLDGTYQVYEVHWREP